MLLPLPLRKLWQGELPLAEAFWRWAVGGGLAVNLLTSIGFLALLMVEAVWAAFFVGYVCSIPYNVLVTVGVWRAAARPDADPYWAGPARIVTVVGMTLLSLT